ncbi:hypothetical protein TanjilG_11209 [Lupinus angustifolius]|uniref:Polymerase nucleotidyl transferase domain-containing protein n=1 Tax=Lupinus angustifolius TaxID=3871 RepID=A0A1J7HPE2_LUPAN|nr:hypothetical protein TanjilG_11209 [Lupinus angustifolius]
MGENEGWAQPPSGLLPNGLLPNESASVIKVVNSERWMKAEERTAELIACIQPSPPSVERRNAVADYVQRLIMKCFPCQVFTFGSVPLKTYLPDGDIDLTAFSKNQNVKDNWAHQVRDMLDSEEKNGNAEFHVKEVQYIQAEVKIIKCLVDNIVVDISFNQLGGLCTLCFLEEVDNLINQDHLFKRSIILIKAWCYYESRLLGAHHGLISTYALETLVLYIFHVFNNSFAGPLEVLYRFLEFFSKFDWDNFCVSLWGPVPISSLPDVTAEPPRKDGGDLLLSKLFLEACGSVYAVFPGGQENQGYPFVSKHFNVIDPLRVNNNLGRSVSKGNFYRIRSAFALGAKRLARLLDCPEEESVFEVNQFFTNTWKRHVIGQQPDAPSNDLSLLRLSSHDEIQMSQNLRNNKHKIDRASNQEFHAEGEHVSRRSISQHSNLSSENSFKSSDVSTVIHTQNQKSHGNQHNSRAFDRVRRETNSNHGAHVDKGQRNVKADNSVSDVHGRFLFARTRSSPDLTDSYTEVSSQGRRTRAPESIKGQNSFAKSEISRRNNLEPGKATNYSVRIDDSSSRHNSSHQVLDSTSESNSVSYSYHDESGIGAVGEEFASVTSTVEMQMMHQEEQDLLNMMASPTAQGFSGHAHIPINYAAGHLPFPPSMLASMGYAHRNMGNIPFIEAPWGANMQFPPGLVPSHFTPYFPGMGLTSNPQDIIETGNVNFSPVEMNSEVDNDVWHEQERSSASGVEVDNGDFEMLADDKQQSTSNSYNFAPPSRVGSSTSSARIQQKFRKENQGLSREEHIGRRTRAPESIKGQNSFAKSEISRRNNLEPGKATNYSVRIDDSSSRHNSSHQVLDSTSESNSVSYSYHDESGIGAVGEEFASVTSTVEMQMMHQEEQDLLNMMASPTAQGFSGHAHIPINYAAGHLPFPPSMLASMGYAHRNMGNIPFIEAPWGANMQFPPGLVPSHFTPYFPGMGLTSNPQDIIETGNVNFSPVEMNSEVDNDVWHEQERSSASGVEVDNGDFEMLADDKQQSTSNSYNFAPPSRVGSSTSSARIQQKFRKENQGLSREEHIGNFHYQDGRRNEVYFDDRIANSQLPSPSPSSSLRSKTSSESSWDGSSAKSSKSTREKRGKKNAPSAPSALHGKGKNVSEISSKRVDDENRELTPASAVESDISERSTRAPTVSSVLAPRHQIPVYEVAQTSGTDSPLPVAPMILGPGSRQRVVDNSGVAPFTFYPTGPPVPFVTMLPLYNFPSESSDTSTSNFSLEGGDNNDFGHNVDSYEGSVQTEVSSLSNSMPRTTVELSEHKSDILNSDFVSHWHNLQYGRFCQNTRHPPSMVYPSPVMVPPIYLQSHNPWDGPGRPVSANMNIFSQLMSYGPRLLPVAAPVQSVSGRPATNIYQRFADDMPRYRSGTGTYLPNPKVSVRDRHSTNTRRGNYNYDRSDHHGDREGNWNMNSKFRATGRGHNRNHTEKPSSKPERLETGENRVERQWGSHRHDSASSHQNGPDRSNTSQNNPANVAYGMYPIPGMNPSGVSSNGPTMPSVVMFYPYDHNVGYSTPAEQLEFGSLGAMGFSGVNELSQPHEGSRSGGVFEEQRFQGGSAHLSSPDQPSSPHVSR